MTPWIPADDATAGGRFNSAPGSGIVEVTGSSGMPAEVSATVHFAYDIAGEATGQPGASEGTLSIALIVSGVSEGSSLSTVALQVMRLLAGVCSGSASVTQGSLDVQEGGDGGTPGGGVGNTLKVVKEGVLYDRDDDNDDVTGGPYFTRNLWHPQCALASPTFAVLAWQHPYETRFTSFNPTTGEVYEQIGLPGNPGYSLVEVGPHRVVAIQWPGVEWRGTELPGNVGRVVEVWGPGHAGTAGHVTRNLTLDNSSAGTELWYGELHFDEISTITFLLGNGNDASKPYVLTLDVTSFALNTRMVDVGYTPGGNSPRPTPFQGGILVSRADATTFFAPDGTTKVLPLPAEVLGASLEVFAKFTGSLLPMVRKVGDEPDAWETYTVEYKDGALKWVATMKSYLDLPSDGVDPYGVFADLPQDNAYLWYFFHDMEGVRPRGTGLQYHITYWDVPFYDLNYVWYRTVVTTDEDEGMFADQKVPLRFGGDEETWNLFGTGFNDLSVTDLKGGYYLACYMLQQGNPAAENAAQSDVINTRVGFQFGQYGITEDPNLSGAIVAQDAHFSKGRG